MFARVKRNAKGGAYLVIVENRRVVNYVGDGTKDRVLNLEKPTHHKQTTLVNLGQIAHLSEARQAEIAASLTKLLEDVRPLKVRG